MSFSRRSALLRAVGATFATAGASALSACSASSRPATPVRPSAATAAARPTATPLDPVAASVKKRLSATPAAGTPTGALKRLSAQTARQGTSLGAIYVHAGGAFFVAPEVQKRWATLGGAAGMLGWPVSESEPWGDGQRQRFQRGNIVTAPGMFADANRFDVIVNKSRQIQPLEFQPGDLVDWHGVTIRQIIVADAEAMLAAAAAAGVVLVPLSGFRSYQYQVNLFQSYEASRGVEHTELRSARPGFSEHQTGLAFDVGGNQGCSVESCFADTDAAKWVAANAHNFGFTVRYGYQQTGVTGYDYEPWHLRYVGREVAADMVKRQIFTLEQFYGLPAAPTYL